MARRGGSRRTYVRDARGRFASTPGGGARKAAQSQSEKKGTLASRSSLKRSQSKLAAKDKADQSLQGTLSRRAQKGAVTRGNKALKAAKDESRTRLKVGKPEGVIEKKKGVGSRGVYEVKINSKRGGGVLRIIEAQSKGGARVEALRRQYGAKEMTRFIGKGKIKAKRLSKKQAEEIRRSDAAFRKMKG